MRPLLMLAAFITTSALACPNLKGTYPSCRSATGNSEGTRDVVVKQTESNGIVTFHITSTDEETQERSTTVLVADGKTMTESETDAETGLQIITQTRVFCQSTTLKVETKAFFDGQPFLHASSSINKRGRELVQTISYQSLEESWNETIICD